MDEVDNYTCNNGYNNDEDNYTCNNGWKIIIHVIMDER